MPPADPPQWLAGHRNPTTEWIAELSTASMELTIELGSAAADVDVAERAGVRCLVQGILYGLPDEPDGPARGLAARVVDAYLAMGDGLLDHLKGFFGLVLCDRRQDRLLAVRDPLGVQPLFFAETPRGLLLSPSIRALQTRPEVGGAVNRAALADHLRHLWPRPTETYFERVSRVLPGHVLTVRRGSMSAARYWDPLFPGRRPEWVDEADLGQFDVLLDASVDRVVGAAPAAIFLSGGLDSVAVGALAADRARRDGSAPPLALSLVFPEPYSEKVTQQGVARQLGLPQLFTDLDDVLGRDGLVRAAVDNGGLSAPMQNPWLPAYRSLARRARGEGREVILTGSGGDEWLTVTPMFAADLIRSGRFGQLVRLGRAQSRSYDVAPLLLARNLAWRFGLRPLLAREREQALRKVAPARLRARRLAARRAALQRRPWLAPDQALRRELIERDQVYVREKELEPDLSPIGGPTAYFRECREALSHPLISMEAEEVYEYSRAEGVRILHPYGDTRLVEFLHATPPHLLNSGGRSKGLIRAMLARRFPDLGFERQRKLITASYFGRAVVAQAPLVWQELGGARALADAGIVEPRMAGELYGRDEEAPDADAAPTHTRTDPMWELLTLESWFRAHS